MSKFWVKVILWMILVQEVIPQYFQNDYHVYPHHSTILWFNKEAFNAVDLVNFKYNRTTTAYNATMDLKRNLTNDLSAVVAGYKFLSNEYRPFPINFKIDLCKTLRLDSFGVGTMVAEFSDIPNKCPVPKGVYHLSKYVLDESKFPPRIPKGKYKMAVESYEKDTHMVSVEVFIDIVPIENYRYE